MCSKNTFDKIETVFISRLLTKISGYVKIKVIKIQQFYMSKMKYFYTRLIINTLKTWNRCELMPG